MLRTLLVSVSFIVFFLSAFTQENIISICPGSNQTITADMPGINFRWQVDSGNGFKNVSNSATFAGTTSASLVINNISSALSGFNFRCVVDENFSDIKTINFTNIWLGTNSPFWKDTSNWGCGILPDSTTNVWIEASNVLLSSNAKVNSIYIAEDAKLTVSPGSILEIASKKNQTTLFNLTTNDLDYLDELSASLSPIVKSTESTKGITLLPNSFPSNKAALLQSLLSNASILSEEKNTVYEGIVNDRFTPTHNGFVYSFGSADLGLRQKPPNGDSIHKQYSVIGTDCSGFMVLIMNMADVPMPDVSATGFEKALKKLLKENQKPEILKLVNKDKLGLSALQDGDIVVWSVKKHIGIVAEVASGNPIVFQSNGQPYPKSFQGNKKVNGVKVPRTAEEEQAQNLSISRGVHPIKFSEMIKNPATSGYWGTGYTILRFEEFEVKTDPPPNPNPGGGFTTLGTISDSSAQLSGQILSNGGSSLISRGICWSKKLSKLPTIADSRTNDGSQLGAFSSNLQQLLAGTKYIARAYAINATDTAYGNPIVFNTNGTMDTLATLTSHGIWDAIFWSDSKGGTDKLGVLQEEKFSSQCPDLVTNVYQSDKIQMLFNPNKTGSYNELEFDKYWSVQSGDCTLQNPVSKYDWIRLNITWEYNRATRTITFQFVPQEPGEESYVQFKIESISADELTGNYSITYLDTGETYALGYLKLK